MIANLTEIYNEDGLLSEIKRENSVTNINYNNQGDPIKVECTTISGEREYVLEYEYEYDSNMNWVKKWEIRDGKRRLIEEREYIYFAELED